MNRNFILYLLSVFLFLTPGKVDGQSDVLKEITAKYLNYCREMPRDEVFVRTDRAEYIAGEEMWFSTLLIDRQTSRPETGSCIIYVELLNSENHPVSQKRIKTDNGSGSGEILLPDTLATGCYTLRAYTGWMKNFLPLNCFIKKITVFNALGKSECITCKADYENSAITQGRPDMKYNSLPDYFSFNVNYNKSSNINFSIQASNIYRAVNNNICYLFIESHGLIEFTGRVNLHDQVTNFSIPSESFERGVTHITLFDSKGIPLDEKYIYTRGKKEGALTIATADNYGRRENVSFEIKADRDLQFSADSANISISVIPKTDIRDGRIDDYLIFGSEFGILPDNIAEKDPDEITDAEMESFLSASKSNWIDWNYILSGNYPETIEASERESHILSGRLINSDSHQPVENKLLVLSIPGKNATFQYSVTDKNGKFKFMIPISENEQDLVIQPRENEKGNTIEFLSSFDEKYKAEIFKPFKEARSVPEYISQWSSNYQVNRIYGIVFSEAFRKMPQLLPGKNRFYGKPDIELKLDDYIKLPVMQEVFFELLPGISLKNHKSVYDISMVDPFTKGWLKTRPVLLIDGVLINDATAIANLDPEIVEKIDVINRNYFVGDFVFNGLVNVITRAGDFSCTSLPEQAVRLKYKVIDSGLSFREPVASDAASVGNNNIPDFRNTLYWNPSVRPDKDGKLSVKFRTSDNIGEYEIIVQGLTSDGRPLSMKKSFRVN